MPVDPAKPFDLTFRVGPAHAGARLDLYVKAMMPSMSRTRIQERIGEDRVQVNGQARPANWRVRLGDDVLLRCRAPGDDPEAAGRVPLDIVHEDDHIVVVNKPSGLLVHPVGKHRHDTLLNGLYWKYKDLLPPEAELSLANRLDQHTSGLVLAAKTTEAKRFLQDEFESRRPEKKYLALCLGLPAEDRGEIDLPLGRAHPTGQGGRDHCLMAVIRDGSGKPSQTRYEVLERFPEAGVVWVSLSPVTGRQHQLRVHMAAIGHPLVCDARYGDGRPLRLSIPDSAKTSTVERYALHAAELTFIHPATGAPLTLHAPPPADLRDALELLRLGAGVSE